MTTDELLDAFKHRTPVILNSDGIPRRGIISAIEYEDGSGNSFNVRIRNNFGAMYDCYIRTNNLPNWMTHHV